MGIREIIYKFKNWKLVFGVVLIAVTMLMVPFNLMNTFNSPKFITYMGSSLEDILIEVENGEKLEESYVNTKQLLDRDRAIAKYYEYRRVRVQTLNSEGRRFNLHIESGEYAGNELEYLNGKAPEGNKELAISYLNSKETGKQTGDKLTLFIGDGVQEFIISGVYQDVTSGGFTAKTKYHFSELPAEKYSFTVNLIEGNNIKKKAEEWSKNLGSYVTVDPMKELINQTLGRVVKQFRTSIVVIAIISTSLVVLITILFLRLRLAKDLAEIAALKAIGFSEGDIKKQYMIKIGCVSLLGIFLGILMTDILGERLVEGALNISGLGIRKVQLIANPLIEYIVYPILLITLVLFVTGQVMKVIRKYNIITIINE